MAFAVVASTTKLGSGTTSNIDSTGATLLIVVVTTGGTAAIDTISDSKSNTWSQLTRQGSEYRTRIFYVANPTVGASHNVTVNTNVSFPVIFFYAFSGATTTSPFDVENGGSGSGTSQATGSITPNQNGSLLIAGCVAADLDTADWTIDNAFTLNGQDFTGGTSYAGAFAWKEQATAAAINPTFTWSTPAADAAVIAAFKPSGGGAAATIADNGGPGMPFVGRPIQSFDMVGFPRVGMP